MAKEKYGLRPLAEKLGLEMGAIRGALDRRDQRVSNIEQLTAAIGWELYIGPPRGGAEIGAEDSDPVPATLFPGPGADIIPWPIPTSGDQDHTGPLYSPRGCAMFGSRFLWRYDLDPSQCVVLEIEDCAMAPTLPCPSVALADKRRGREPKPGLVYAVSQNEDLFVRRLVEVDGDMQAISDRGTAPPMNLRDGIDVVGLIVWSARVMQIECRKAGS